ncbi:MAG TPA: IPT/TIG domain-containing protein [Bryobacteraceae bacterium]|nr:IPT/TIG domain-containing protein [Bryobacteraceae bacterium]
MVRYTFLGLGLTVSYALCQNSIRVGPNIDISGTLGAPVASFSPPVGTVFVNGGPANVKFKFTGVTSLEPAVPVPFNFVVVSPSSGTAGSGVTSVAIGLNESVLRSMDTGTFPLNVIFSTVDQTPPVTAAVMVTLHLSGPPVPVIGSVLNTASYQPAISPGEMVSIFGSNLGPPMLSTEYDDTGAFPTSLGDGSAGSDTTVLFNGIPAPLLYVSPGQINGVVPYGVAGQKTASIVLTRYFQTSATFTVAITDTSPGIFTATQNGSGQGAILNYRQAQSGIPIYTYNSVDNPAPQGSVIEMFATGAGVWNPPAPDGAINLVSTDFTTQPVSLTIGGQPARIYYAGSAPYEVWGMLQIIAFVPTGIGSGPQPVVLTVGQQDNSQQRVTIAVQ